MNKKDQSVYRKLKKKLIGFKMGIPEFSKAISDIHSLLDVQAADTRKNILNESKKPEMLSILFYVIKIFVENIEVLRGSVDDFICFLSYLVDSGANPFTRYQGPLLGNPDDSLAESLGVLPIDFIPILMKADPTLDELVKQSVDIGHGIIDVLGKIYDIFHDYYQQKTSELIMRSPHYFGGNLSPGGLKVWVGMSGDNQRPFLVAILSLEKRFHFCISEEGGLHDIEEVAYELPKVDGAHDEKVSLISYYKKIPIEIPVSLATFNPIMHEYSEKMLLTVTFEDLEKVELFKELYSDQSSKGSPRFFSDTNLREMEPGSLEITLAKETLDGMLELIWNLLGKVQKYKGECFSEYIQNIDEKSGVVCEI